LESANTEHRRGHRRLRTNRQLRNFSLEKSIVLECDDLVLIILGTSESSFFRPSDHGVVETYLLEMSFLRHASPLTFEPLSPSPSEILVRDSEDDDDIDQRAAKRRRVERLGQQYLRGQPLLISTATLLGPFDANWVNPWKRTGHRSTDAKSMSGDRERRAREDWQKQEVRREGEKIHGKIEIFPTSIYSARKAVLRDRQAVKSVEVSRAKSSQTTRVPNPFSEDIVALREAKVVRKAKRHLQTERREQRVTDLRKDGLWRDLDDAVGLETHDLDVKLSELGTSRLWKGPKGPAGGQDREVYTWAQKRPDSPTPAARIPHTPPYQRAITPQTGSTNQPQRIPSTITKPFNLENQRHSPIGSRSGFTPINKHQKAISVASPSFEVTKTAESPTGLEVPGIDHLRVYGAAVVDEIKLTEAEADVVEGFKRAKDLAREAASEANQSSRRSSIIDHAERCVEEHTVGSLAPGRSSLTDASQTQTPQDSEASQPPPTTASARRLLVAVEIPCQKGLPRSSPTGDLGSFRELPPSTNLPAFAYRRGAAVTRNPLNSGDVNSKVVARDESRKRPRLIQFASSSPPKSPAPQQSLSSSKFQGQPLDENSGLRETSNPAVYDAGWGLVDRYTNRIITEETFDDHNGSQQPVGKQIRDIFRQSASSFHSQQCNIAQDSSTHRSASHSRSDPPLHSDGVLNDRRPSPAAGLPESFGDHHRLTESKESRDEDTDNNLSTQAAIARAQRSFQADISSPTKQPSPPPQPNDEALPVSGATIMNHSLPPQGLVTPLPNIRTPSTTGPTLPKLIDEEDPLSTQDLLNGISPFTFSTVKKEATVKNRASFAPSPLDVPIMSCDINDDDTTIFGKLGLDMDTSPEQTPSQKPELRKPIRKSALKKPRTSQQVSHGTSFSITPDGVLKEVYNQDGQGGRVSDTQLEAMIDDVGSFLETWDVEAEMKKCGAGAGSTPSGPDDVKSGFSKRVLFAGRKVS
ncbi:MAG: hypothetical protein M1835_000889, partial [Candelina submexicana]